MEIFEKIGDAASKTYKYTAEKTSKIARETKLKMQINECKRDIEEIYKKIGEAVYEKFIVDEDIKRADLEQNCAEIDTLTQKIVECKDEILHLNEKRQCKNCYEEIELKSRYCPSCGFEQEEIKMESTETEVEESEDEN